jgi:hypothetical protein
MSWNTRDFRISCWQHTAAVEFWCGDCIHQAFTVEELKADIPDVTPTPVYSWDDDDIDKEECCGKCHEHLFDEQSRRWATEDVERG